MKRIETRLISALTIDLPYDHPGAARPSPEEELTPAPATPASVLILFAREAPPRGTALDDLSILFILRTETVQTHKGQIAFPGGVSEEGESTVETALREACEEVGIAPQSVNVLGSLPHLLTHTGFRVTPVVGILEQAIEEVRLIPNPDEIADAFWAPMSVLLQEGTYKKEFFRVGEVRYPIHVFDVNSRRVWGITGAILKNLIDRLSRAGSK